MANSSIACNSGAYTLIGAAAFAALVLAVDVGSYAVTGTAVTFIKGHPITAISGVYTQTGTAIQTRRITAAPAGYILNGTPATLRYSTGSKVVTATGGTYTITGTTATKIEYAKPYTKGQYVLTGATVSFLRSLGPRLSVSSGSYGLTGTASGLLSTVTIASGDYGLTGSPVTFRKGKSLTGLSGSYSIANTPTTKLEQSRHFSVASGIYTFTGTVTPLRYSGSHAIFIVADPGMLILNGTTTPLLMARRLAATSGAYTITGGHTVFRKQYNSGSYGITGTAATLIVNNRRVTAVSGAYGLTGTITPLIYSIHRLSLDSGVYNLASIVTPITGAFILTNAIGSYGVAGPDLTLRATHIMADSGAYVITPTVTTLRASRIGRWRNQSKQPAVSSKQPPRTTTWDPEQGATGV